LSSDRSGGDHRADEHDDIPGEQADQANGLRIVQVANRNGASTAQIVLAWLLARYERMLLIPGTTSVAHLQENMRATEIELDDADLAALDTV